MKISSIAFVITSLVHTGSIQDYVSAEVIIVNPPNIDSDLDVTCNVDNDNVLKAAIEQANNGDTIQLSPGMYYLACHTDVDKQVTILGSCSGIPAPSDESWNNDGTQIRPGCTASGESIIVASKEHGDSNGALHGIFIETSDVTIDGLVFFEESETFRGMINVLMSVSLAEGTFTNIQVLNNYMKGDKSGSTYLWGGQVNSQPKVIDSLVVKGNFIDVNAFATWEPIGFHGNDPWNTNALGSITLNNFELSNNSIGCPGNPCQVINFGNTLLQGTTIISGNNFYDNIEGDGSCPYSITSGLQDLIPVYSDNINADFKDCKGVVKKVKKGKSQKKF